MMMVHWGRNVRINDHGGDEDHKLSRERSHQGRFNLVRKRNSLLWGLENA